MLVFKLLGLSMFAVKEKIIDCSINNPALSLLMKHLVIGQRQKAPNFSAFHWSPHGRLVSIGQNFVTTKVVHLPKRTETSVIAKSDQSGPNHQLLQLCTACTAWSESVAGWLINLLLRFTHLSEGPPFLPIAFIVKWHKNECSWKVQYLLKDTEFFKLKFCEMKSKMLLLNFNLVVNFKYVISFDYMQLNFET